MATSHGMLISNNDIAPESLVDLKGDVKIVEHQSNKNPNTSLFVLEKEDHTVANLLRNKLHQNSLVKQAGYRVPHPTQHRVEMRIQTASDRSGKEVPTPQAALLGALQECMSDLKRLETMMVESLESVKVDSRHLPLQVVVEEKREAE
jgi:DNA-directed RNA polymerase II subunit RPB11